MILVLLFSRCRVAGCIRIETVGVDTGVVICASMGVAICDAIGELIVKAIDISMGIVIIKWCSDSEASNDIGLRIEIGGDIMSS